MRRTWYAMLGMSCYDSVTGLLQVVDDEHAMEVLYHYVNIKNQVVFIDPPLEDARAELMLQFNTWMRLICDLPRIDEVSTARRSCL